jgi:RNA recognition motif-containing protein
LRRELYVICSQFGNVLDVVALKTPKMRGQAHVVFQHITSASAALQKLQGFEFYGKGMKTMYGKGKSDAVAKEEGTFVPKHKRKGEKTVAAHKLPPAKKGPAAETTDLEKGKQPPAAQEAESEDVDMAEGEPNKILFLQRLPAEVRPEFHLPSSSSRVKAQINIFLRQPEHKHQSLCAAKDRLSGRLRASVEAVICVRFGPGHHGDAGGAI